MKNFALLLVVAFLSVGCGAPQPRLSRTDKNAYAQCIKKTLSEPDKDNYIIQTEDGESIPVTKEQAAEISCSQKILKVAKERSRINKGFSKITKEEHLARVESTLVSHKSCDTFGTDVIGRYEAGCPLKKRQVLLLKQWDIIR